MFAPCCRGQIVAVEDRVPGGEVASCLPSVSRATNVASVDKRVDDRRPLPRAIRVRGELSPFRSLRLVARVPSSRALNLHSHNALSQRGCVVRGIHEDASLLSRDPSWRVCAPANTVTKHRSPIVSSTSLRAGIDGDRLLSIITVAWTIENFPWLFNFGFSMIIKKK